MTKSMLSLATRNDDSVIARIIFFKFFNKASAPGAAPVVQE